MPYTGTVQSITFITRNPTKTREEFYKYWSTVHAPIVAPAEKHGVISYRQHHKAGTIVPNLSDKSAPGAESDNLPTTPVEYDGFVVWELPSLEAFHKAFQDPYYIQVIEPDEHNLIDKNSFAGGIIASFSGPLFEAMKEGKSALEGADVEDYRKKFEEFEVKQKK